jgi:hypothetical protein
MKSLGLQTLRDGFSQTEPLPLFPEENSSSTASVGLYINHENA